MQQGDRIPPVKTKWYPSILPKRYSPNIFSRALQNIWTLIDTIASILRENMNGYLSLNINFSILEQKMFADDSHTGGTQNSNQNPEGIEPTPTETYDNPHWHKLISCRYASEDWRRCEVQGELWDRIFYFEAVGRARNSAVSLRRVELLGFVSIYLFILLII